MTPEAKKLLQTIEAALHIYPQLRLGQLLANVALLNEDIFYAKDTCLTKRLEKFLEENKNG